jgi:hypothetical protein
VQDILASWSRHPAMRLKLTFLMDGIYSDGSAIRKSDPFYEPARRFMDIVAYGRGGPAPWSKLTLLETLGIIGSDERRYEYLQRILPAFEQTLSSAYRIELQLNEGPVRVLRRGAAGSTMALQFRFVDSAADLMPTIPLPEATVLPDVAPDQAGKPL